MVFIQDSLFVLASVVEITQSENGVAKAQPKEDHNPIQ